MPKMSYICTHGIIWGEISDSGVTRSYGHDALGSVTETFVNGALENTYRYKPYGSLLAKTGSAPDPSFLWNGGSGYRAAALGHVEFNVRRRHYTSSGTSWSTADPLWPAQRAFAYATGNPVCLSDSSGLSVGSTDKKKPCCCCASDISATTSPINPPPKLGSNFFVYVDLLYIPWPKGINMANNGECSLSWNEKTDHFPTLYGPVPPDTWTDVTHVSNPNSATFYAWKHRPAVCPGSVEIVIADTPSLAVPG